MLQQFTIDRIYSFKETTGWFTAVTEEGDSLVGTAIFPPSGTITAEGDWENHPKFGRQFKATKIIFNDMKEVIGQLLASGFLTGLKKSKAQNMVNALGQDVFRVLDACIMEPVEVMEWQGQTRSPIEVLLSVHGVGKIVAQQILESWKARRGIMNVAILGIRAGMNPQQFREALSVFGEMDLIYKILHDPYGLTVVSGIRWEDADLIALLEWEGKSSFVHNSPQRLGAALREVIERQRVNGHMCFPFTSAILDAELLCGESNIWNIVKDMLEELHLVIYQGEVVMITTKRLYEMEINTAHNLNRLQEAVFKKPFPSRDINVQEFSELDLSPEQIDAINMALNNNVSIITGGPGVGKTHSLKTLLKILDHHRITYTLCAFIAKVAIRMREATGVDAYTLHSYFEIFKDEEERHELDTDYLIIDEMSTVGMDLLDPILDLIPDGCRVVFVGDHNQLPPIGSGEPLAQMLKAGVPSVYLKTIYRFSETSGVATAAHEILNGRVPTSNKKDFISVTENDFSISQRIVKAINWMMEKGISFEDIQVLTPVNAGPAGRVAMNNLLQQTYNPKRFVNKIKGETSIKEGDKVIHTKNNRKLGVMNGEIGMVSRIAVQDNEEEPSEEMIFAKEEPLLWVSYPFHDIDVAYTKSALKELQLAYAVTVHKFIGSQAEGIVVVLTHTRDSFMLRQLPYTAITRASNLCAVISAPGAFQKFVANSQRWKRFSILSELLNSSNLEE